MDYLRIDERYIYLHIVSDFIANTQTNQIIRTFSEKEFKAYYLMPDIYNVKTELHYKFTFKNKKVINVDYVITCENEKFTFDPEIYNYCSNLEKHNFIKTINNYLRLFTQMKITNSHE